jgi:hypothetical protein
MQYKLLILLLSLILLVGVVSADTSIVFTPNTSDGYEQRQLSNSTFENLKTGAGTQSDFVSSQSTTAIYSDSETNKFLVISRTSFIFPSPSIPPSGVIDSVTLSMYPTVIGVTLGDTGISPIKFNPSGSLKTSDYNRYEFTPYASYKNLSTLTTTGYYSWNFNSFGISNISKSGTTGIGIVTEYDAKNISPAWIISKNMRLSMGTAESVIKSPYLTIEWTPDTTPPNSITNLSNNTALCSEVTWTWTNPTDADYAYLYTLKNNVWTGNYSNSTSSATWLTLSPLTSYTFSSRTVDLDGNMNTTFVNRTVTTPVCPVTPITSFTSNVTCGNLPTVAVQFNDTSNNNGYAITGYNWTFGDGNTSTLQNPVNTYKVAGAYWVNHSAGNVAGATWSNVSRYMIVVPDWGTCAPATGNVYYISNSQETPVAIVIPIVAILLLVMWVRRK